MATQPENNPVTQEGTKELSKIINLSKDYDKFAKAAKEAEAATMKEFLLMLLEYYQTPPEDNSAAIANLEQQLTDANLKIAAYEEQINAKNAEIKEWQDHCTIHQGEITDLKMQLTTARNEANDNATKAQQLILKYTVENPFEIRFTPNPVVMHFLTEMSSKEAKAGKTDHSPAYILEKLFMDDLQNPRANNLPYTVTAAQIREVMAQLKKQEE